jgi:hypothetical protein
MKSESRLCCDDDGCVQVTGTTPCQTTPPRPAPTFRLPGESSLDPDIRNEDEMPLRAFGEQAYTFRHSLRGRFATALLHPGYQGLYIVDIEGEFAERMPHPDHGYDLIMTRCLLRVRETLRGDVRPGERMEVLYEGGALSREHQYWPRHTPKCMPFDQQLLGVVERPERILRADYAVTVAL